MALVLAGQPQKDDILYYEVHLETAGMHQIGWAALDAFQPNTETGDGVGDDASSYAVDAGRLLTFHDGHETQYGQTPVKPGDILGCLYDTKEKSLSYTVNGQQLGIAFQFGDNCTIGSCS
jgi:hypothetical protein